MTQTSPPAFQGSYPRASILPADRPIGYPASTEYIIHTIHFDVQVPRPKPWSTGDWSRKSRNTRTLPFQLGFAFDFIRALPCAPSPPFPIDEPPPRSYQVECVHAESSSHRPHPDSLISPRAALTELSCPIRQSTQEAMADRRIPSSSSLRRARAADDVVGQFIIGSEIGKGSFAQVYMGRHKVRVSHVLKITSRLLLCLHLWRRGKLKPPRPIYLTRRKAQVL